MPRDATEDQLVLEAAYSRARAWFAGIPTRGIPAGVTIDGVQAALGVALPEAGAPPQAVIEALADAVEPGLMASQSPRFFGWVMGGTYPVALAADWLTSAWDQNAGMREVTTGVVGAEEVAGRWAARLLGLPDGCEVGFTTGATMANFTCMAAARTRVLGDAGWDVAMLGLTGAPRVRFLVGAERHGSVDLAGSLLGLGAPTVVDADDQGRIRADALERVLAGGAGPAIVVLQAGNIHSGAFDPFVECVAAARRHGAWIHVDGAFGLWAAASPRLRHLMAGAEGADSWATDAHKTLNVPYDCGIAIVRDAAAVRSAMGMHASYLAATASTEGDPHEHVPELSRRARGVPVWAVLRWLGSAGVARLDRRPRRCGHGARGWARRDARRRGSQRRGVHPGLRRAAHRCRDPRAGRRAPRRWSGVRIVVALARPGGAAVLGEQRRDGCRGRAGHARRRRGGAARGIRRRLVTLGST